MKSIYSEFMDRNRMNTDRLIKQGFRYSELCKTFKKFSGKHRTIFNSYGVSVRQHIDEVYVDHYYEYFNE